IINQKTTINRSTIALIGCVIPLFFWILESQWKHFQRGFYPRAVEIESMFEETGMQGPAIFGRWSRVFKRTPISKRNGYFWDGLFNPSVFISYILEIGFLIIMAAIAPQLGK
ncbi:MAG: hypothetical protein AAFW70_00740, partial [Cyanobacteria bacterium J06635_10]